jgi:serine protease inhibitor
MPMYFSRHFARVVACAAVAGCTRATEPGGLSEPLVELPRALTAAEQKVVAGSNAFSFALIGKVVAAQPAENTFISPLSASYALGMTMNGAASTTWDEMRSALQLGEASQAEINGAYKSLTALLTSLDPAVSMQVANSIWFREGFPVLESFLTAARSDFDAEARALNFANSAASLSAINGWVDTKTNHRIPTIIDEIRPEHVMFLINAIYFKGNWREKFDATKTIDGTFSAAGGSTQPVRLMHVTRDSISYVETQAYQAVDLPYGNGAFSMTVVLPRAGTDINALVSTLATSSWNSLTASLQPRKVELFLPRLTLNWERKLNDDLKALGMLKAFAPGGADFTRMAAAPTGNQLYIDFVKQKTFVAVDEEGTEAAAATAVGIGVTSAPIIPVMRVDRPYFFVLRERLSGTLLFMGKISRMPQ